MCDDTNNCWVAVIISVVVWSVFCYVNQLLCYTKIMPVELNVEVIFHYGAVAFTVKCRARPQVPL